MLYTRKGDAGTTKTFGCDQRVSKSSSITEALGSLDEINSFLGLIKIKAGGDVSKTIDRIQQDLFIIQAAIVFRAFYTPLPAVSTTEPTFKKKLRSINKVTDYWDQSLGSESKALGSYLSTSSIRGNYQRRVREAFEIYRQN